MSTETQVHPVVAQAKETTEQMKGRMLRTFGFVPDDKLTWSPAPTCKSALQVAAHAAVSNGFFVNIIKRIPMPSDVPMDEMLAEGKRQENAIQTREQAIQAIEESIAAVQAALDNLSPEDIDATVETPIFTAPMPFWMFLPARHMDNHAAQIDMLQTCWGDMEWHM